MSLKPKEIANKSWDLLNDYYKDGEKSSGEILTEIEKLAIQSQVDLLEEILNSKKGYIISAAENKLEELKQKVK